MLSNETIAARVEEHFGGSLQVLRELGEVTLKVEPDQIISVCQTLRDDPAFQFEQLIDLCGVDYLEYAKEARKSWDGPRFAVVYHLLSVAHNARLRLRAFLDEESLIISSVTEVWSAANWYEREAFDLLGIVFEGHPDLRRILTDYGFIGHPFRKDFPLIGHVEMRYDPDKQRVVYQPVTIEPRTLVPKIIREEEFGDRNP